MDKPVIIFGAGSLGKAALEIFQANNIVVYCFLDDDETLHGTQINDIGVMSHTDDHGYLKYIGQKCEAFVAEENPEQRKKIVSRLNERRKVMPVNAIHNSSVIAASAEMRHGCFVDAGVVIGSNAKIGNHCILHSGALVDYEVSLGDFVQVGAGSVIAAGAKVKEKVLIGSGVTIVGKITIGKGANIGPGSVVVRDVEAGATVFGNPAKEVG
jgi:sugar O-acyltransferase (sialic acid O-acetyltransferase NeuD family)